MTTDSTAAVPLHLVAPGGESLDAVRERLESLQASRLYRALGIEERTEYRRLCRVEERLLSALKRAAQPHSAKSARFRFR